MKQYFTGRFGVLLALLLTPGLPASAQQLNSRVVQQMNDLLRLKASMTPAQKKVSSALVMSAMAARHQPVGSVPNNLMRATKSDSDGTVAIDVKATSLAPVLKQIQALGGSVLYSSETEKAVRAKLPLLQVESLAETASVLSVRPAARARTNGAAPVTRGFQPALRQFAAGLHVAPFIGAVTSQGYITHQAREAIQAGFDGAGVKVGVLSDSASPGRVAALIASGDLPPDVTVLPGQDGVSQGGGDEGTAMMEIIHDMAPGAKLYFATAFISEASFADNIRKLRFQYGCDVIVDDISYFDEAVFQDSTVAKAVNDVTANGALYFSSAANSGNVSNGTSGTWEGDFKNGGSAGSLINGVEGKTVSIHNFAASGAPQLYDTVTAPSSYYDLQWSDPQGQSANDYDFFVLDRTGTQIKAASVDLQNGRQDPYEAVSEGDNCDQPNPTGYCPAAGDRVVVILYNGSARALHIDTERGQLQIATSGATFGHNAAASTVSMAATAWNSAHNGTHPFTGFANRTETFSSDGPRKIFFQPNGTPITPGNFLFRTSGGTTLQKPDLTAADGVFTHTPGFLPFFGTSAAAPHAAAIAALVKSAKPSLTNTQIRTIMRQTALDTMTPGTDRDAGYGITMALAAVEAAIGQ